MFSEGIAFPQLEQCLAPGERGAPQLEQNFCDIVVGV